MSSQKGNFLVIIGVLVIVIAVGGLGYYLGSQKNAQPKIEKVTQFATQPEINPQVSISPSPAVSTGIPSDWTLESSKYCSFKFYLPPNKAPYFEQIENFPDPINRRFWQVRDFNDPKTGQSNITIIHVADSEASGFISGQVFVSCRKNTDSKNAEQILQDFSVGITNKEMGTGLKSEREDNLWGQQVKVGKFNSPASIEDFENYFFTTKDYAYTIGKTSASKDPQVQNTTNIIFNNLQFTD